MAEFSTDRVLRMAPVPVVPAVDLLGSLVLAGLLGAAGFRRIRRG